MAWIPLALTVVSTVMQMQSAQDEAKAAQGAADFNASMAEREAAAKEASIRTQSQRQLATMRSGVGKSGATGGGSSMLAIAESAANAEIDALNTRATGASQSALYRAQGQNAQSAGWMKAGTALLSGASKMATGWGSSTPKTDKLTDFYQRGNRGVGD